ncbi:DUF4382 domain-containing protein [Aggregatimonas sangjinii]|uniref:DUF4382 domain-containing protein n=1 Tax=Aggregatimonas sangjinii TaxID=2583587 RepID=A0A5B7STB7_9FLAO|nr:DUF4382 domain-containing protein [Aggregatimonas sangjinii]QCW99933.1 DUF4382 domain-containing protein [Aggregatimonas sangjinii]
MKSNFISIAIIVFGFLFISCSNSENPNDYGRLKVQLTDAPFPHDLVAEANVTIFKVDARYKGDVALDMQAMDSTDVLIETDQGNPFVVLMENEVQVNLLELTNGITTTLVDTDVPVGSYDLIRVYVKGINVVLTDGTVFNLDVPSGAQSGIKVFIKPGLIVNGGLSSDLLLDFDVSKSFVQKSGGFNFKPVIKASNLSTAGTLMGTVTAMEQDALEGIEGAQVAVFIADTLNTTTFSDIDGGYMLMGLEAGSYRVEVEKDGYSMQTVDDIQINAANKTTQDFELVLEE